MVLGKFKRLLVISIFICTIICTNCTPKKLYMIESCILKDDTITLLIKKNGVRIGDIDEVRIGKYHFYDKSKIDEESLNEFSYELMFFDFKESDFAIKIVAYCNNTELKEKPVFVNGNSYKIYLSNGPQHIQADFVYKDGVFEIQNQHYSRAS